MQSNSTMNPRLLKPTDAAAYLAVSERTLWAITKSHQIPAVRIGRAVRYDLKDLESFISQAKEGSKP